MTKEDTEQEPRPTLNDHSACQRGSVPVSALRTVIEYLWDDEQQHASEDDCPEQHIFASLMAVNSWLTGVEAHSCVRPKVRAGRSERPQVDAGDRDRMRRFRGAGVNKPRRTTMEDEDNGPPFGVVIATYTREQAIDDGVLLDVTEMAREAGFRCPVALTQAVNAQYVEVPPGMACQDEKGRLWDILWMLRVAMIRARLLRERIPFELYVRNNADAPPQLVRLVAGSGPDENGDLVLTVMLPTED